MSERVINIHIKNCKTSYFMHHWGGNEVWIDGLTAPSIVLERYREFSQEYEHWQYGLDGATLIDEDNSKIIIGIASVPSFDPTYDFKNDPDSSCYSELGLRNCQLVRDCYIELASQVWKGWEIKIANLDFAKVEGAITTFDEIEPFPDNGSHDCNLTRIEIHAFCIRRFFDWKGLPQSATCHLLTNQPLEQLPLLESYTEQNINEWLQLLKKYSRKTTQTEIDDLREKLESNQIYREVIYQTICKAYKAVLQKS